MKQLPFATNLNQKHSMVLACLLLQCRMLRISTCIEIVLVLLNLVFVTLQVAATLFTGFYHPYDLMLFTCGGYLNFVVINKTIGSMST